MKKYDLFFQKRVRNMEDETIEFEECYKNSTTKEDVGAGLSFRIPSIDDLIRLKKIWQPNVKDQQDIEYLLKAKTSLQEPKPSSKTKARPSFQGF